MEDLVGALNGGFHVSQHEYDLKALHDYLSQTIVIPSLPISPTSPSYHVPPSRSTSTTRDQKAFFPTENAPMVPPTSPKQYPVTNTYPQAQNSSYHQTYPSPVTNTAFFHSVEELSTPTLERPPLLQRSSSYGFPGQEYGAPINWSSMEASTSTLVPSTSSAYPMNGNMEPASPLATGFESDAFAPLWAKGVGKKERNSSAERSNPWAGFIGQSSIFGRRQSSRGSQSGRGLRDNDRDQRDGPDEMMVDEMMEVEEEDETQFEPAEVTEEKKKGLGLPFGSWERGRRKR